MSFRTCKALAVAAGLVCLAAAGCTDTTVQPKSTVTDANIFTDLNSYTSFIAKVYGGLALTGQQGPTNNSDIQRFDEGFSEYVRVWWQLNQLPTDETVVAWGDPGLPEINTQGWVSSNVWVTAMYARIYFQTAMANEFLRQTTDAKLTARGQNDAAFRALIAQYRAEARFLRALSYWHGIDLFGDIPLVTENDPLGATPPKQSTRTDVYNFIVSELTAIQNQLPPPGAASYGRATPGAAQMLLAHVYLNAAIYTGTPAYDKALAAAQAVITSGAYSLAPLYRNNFLADNNTSPEMIFAVPFDGLRTQTWGGTTFLVHAACGGPLMKNSDYGINGCWWGLRLKPQAYYRYQAAAEPAGDTRASFFFTSGQDTAVNSISTFTEGIAAPKYSNLTSSGAVGSDQTFPDTDFPMFRLTDAYLIYAEAQLRGGGGTPAQALTYVNLVRERAYGGTSGDITAGQLTLPYILDERSRELLWEGHRRTDLIRYGQYTGGTYIWSWKGGTQAGVATDSHLNLYPIPLNELSANPNLKQNPGY